MLSASGMSSNLPLLENSTFSFSHNINIKILYSFVTILPLSIFIKTLSKSDVSNVI